MTFIKVHGAYIGFWLLVLMLARLWLVNPILRELRRLNQGY